MKLAAGTLCMQTLLTRSRVLLQTENVHIAQIDVHEYDSMALPRPPGRATGALCCGSNYFGGRYRCYA